MVTKPIKPEKHELCLRILLYLKIVQETTKEQIKNDFKINAGNLDGIMDILTNYTPHVYEDDEVVGYSYI